MVSPRDIKKHLVHIFERGRVPFVKSSPGRGKSAIFAELSDDFNLELKDIRLSMHEPQDFTGLAFREGNRSRFLPFDLIPLEGEALPKGKNGWLVLLDEFNHAEPEMIRASYKLILDGMVGQNKVHENVIVALAGNGIDDNALANSTGTALNSRVTHLTLGSDADFWLEEIAAPRGFDHRVIGFLSMNKDKLNDFDPDQDEHSFCSERTWHFVSDLILDVPDVSSISPVVAGTISPGVAAEFIQFCEIYKDLITVKTILKDPENTPLPDESSTRWATVTYLARETTPDNADQLALYIGRMPLQYVVIYMQMVKDLPDITKSPNIIKLFGRIGRANR